ncbi:MAG: tetratricopeptide repeat protein [Planctomycetota bacterium]
MVRILPLTFAAALTVTLTGCSAGKALVMGSPARKHSPAEQLAHVADAYASRGDYNTAAEVYNQALALSPGDRRLQRQLADVQRLARDPSAETAPFRDVRWDSEIAGNRQQHLQSAATSVRTVSAPAPTRLQQLTRKASVAPVQQPADWNQPDPELNGFTDEELMGLESPLR